MRNLVGLCVLFATASASAGTRVAAYHPGGMLLLSIDDGGGKLAKLVGTGKQGIVRCYVEADGYTAIFGAGDMPLTGCFVGVSRDGQLVAPPAGKKWSMAHLMP